ncbi:MAG: bifunctional precorrin-2 dehydrogenase/sirohydrochlorin ferrochelatase [Gemmatimonadaceae bacterium]
MSGIPILVEGAALTVLVVGGGPVAVRKAAAFVAAGASVRIVAREPSPTMRELARATGVSLVERAYEPGDIGDASLVIAATSDRATNAAIATDARDAARLVNVVDAPGEGSFATMAIHRAGALVVGVSAGGVPGAAARVRDAIAHRFDERYAGALAGLATLRRAMLDRGASSEWRALTAEVIDDEFCETVESDRLDARVAAWR